MSAKRGVLFVYSGPSGVGKGTLKDRLLAEFGEEIGFSVSMTTREKRPGETEGRDYVFISRREFEARIANGEFLEYAEYAGNLYGTPRAFVERLLGDGLNVLLEIEVRGAIQVKQRMPESVSIFVLPPSFEELERRLRGRGTESEETILRRLETARGELDYAGHYDHRIVNGDLDAAYAQLRDVYLDETRRANAADA